MRRVADKVPIDGLTVHRLLLTALLVAAKFFDDDVYNNAEWAKVGGGALLRARHVLLPAQCRSRSSTTWSDGSSA
jgi:hypothetical protein